MILELADDLVVNGEDEAVNADERAATTIAERRNRNFESHHCIFELYNCIEVFMFANVACHAMTMFNDLKTLIV